MDDHSVDTNTHHGHKKKKLTFSEWIDEHDKHSSDLSRRKYDIHGHTKPLDAAWNILYVVSWLILVTVFVYYVYRITAKYEDNRMHPPQRVSYLPAESLPLPQVTVCNWNQARIGEPCPYCTIELKSCNKYHPDGTVQLCQNMWKPINYTYTGYGVFFCHQFNFDPDNVISSQDTGYSSAYSLVFVVRYPDETDGVRVGAQVTFNLPGVDPDLWNESHWASARLDTFFSLSDIVEVSRSERGKEISSKRHYDSESTYLQLPLRPVGRTEYVGVTFNFDDLSTQEIESRTQYRLQNFWADFAAVLGVLMGIDLVKISSSIVIFIAACRTKNVGHLREHWMG